MTTYLGEKAVGIGTIKATKAVAGDVLHDETLVGNGNTEPLGVDKQVIATTNQVANLSATLHAAIEAQAEAIAKTRNDFEVADQEIRADMNEKDAELEHMITEHAEELTTLRGNQASLGDQVSNIESKIPQSASGSNPLITKQQLLDEEIDIRDDYNGMISELQTQITAQAGEIAKLDSEKIDKNQGTVNAGKYLMVGDDGIVGLTESGGGGGIANVIHDSTLTGAGTNASPLGLSTAIKDEIADKAPKETVEALTGIVNDVLTNSVKKSGDIMTGALNVPELNVQTTEGTLNLSITAGTATIATNNGLDIVSPTKFDKAPTTDDSTTWADASEVSLVRKAQVATAISGKQDKLTAGENITIEDGVISATGGGASLPDQTDNAGKFLTTDGTTASWSDKPLVNNNYSQKTSIIIVPEKKSNNASAAVAIGVGAAASSYSVHVGYNSYDLLNGGGSVGIGYGTQTKNNAIAIGNWVKAQANYAIQIGYKAENYDSNTLKVANQNGNFEMMSADGTIPAERMSTTAGTTGQVLTKTDAGMGWSDVSSTRIIFREWE